MSWSQKHLEVGAGVKKFRCLELEPEDDRFLFLKISSVDNLAFA